MAFAIQIFGYICGLPLELLAIHAMFRGEWRKYVLIFVYVIADFLTAILEMPPNIAYYRGDPNAITRFQYYYWWDERIMQVLAYSIILTLIYQASANLRSRRVLRGALIGGALLFTGVSFLLLYNPHQRIGMWMTPWVRDLYMCAAILDLALWALLLGTRKRNHQLLMLSGAFGIQFTGEAIGAALRDLAQTSHSRLVADLGNLATVASYILFLYILWQAFRNTRRESLTSASV
jgi:hypothetical protein